MKTKMKTKRKRARRNRMRESRKAKNCAGHKQPRKNQQKF
jgi:hypothetical protein